MLYWAVMAAVAALCVFSAITIWRQLKKSLRGEGCSGCTGGSCGGCAQKRHR